MSILSKVKWFIPLDNPARLFYHKIRAVIANLMYGFPHKKMMIIGVTGTNGKTTTCNIIAQWLRAAGKKVFMFTTVNIIVDQEEYVNELKMTSPDVFDLQSRLSKAKKAWCEVAVIETASHGILMNRIWGLNYDIVALTNISQDHLDLHKTMQDYVNTKLQIFKKLMYYDRKPWVKKVSIVNIDSEYSELFIEETADTLLTYWEDYKASVQPWDIKTTFKGTKFELNIPWENLKINTKLLGKFNVYNIMCAACVFTSLWLSREVIHDSISQVYGIPWRMEVIEADDGFNVYIDYAHTEDALINVLDTIKDLEWVQRIITVFWATWDRDKTKRPVMWQVVHERSDMVILTQDDDYSEETRDIIKDILPGVPRKEWEDFWIIPDRREAIRTALITAKEGDAVLLAGKWDERVMVTTWKVIVDWHDKKEVQNILQEIKENTLVK